MIDIETACIELDDLCDKVGWLANETHLNSLIADYQRLQAKEIPMKPIEIEANHFICNACSNGTGVVGQRREWHKVFYPYCQNCGQCIDWSEE